MTLYKQVKDINEAEHKKNQWIQSQLEQHMFETLTIQQETLLQIVHNKERIMVSDVAREMGIGSSAVSQLVAKLERKQYIMRMANQHNRRIVFLSLDEQGHRYFEQRAAIEQQIITQLYQQFTPAELEQYQQFLQRILQATT